MQIPLASPSAHHIAASVPVPNTAKAAIWAYMVPSKLCPTIPPSGTPMNVVSEATTAAPTPAMSAEQPSQPLPVPAVHEARILNPHLTTPTAPPSPP